MGSVTTSECYHCQGTKSEQALSVTTHTMGTSRVSRAEMGDLRLLITDDEQTNEVLRAYKCLYPYDL